MQELSPKHFLPTPTHHFIKLLNDKGILRRCYTQNIDSLEAKAGIPEEKIVAAHGNFDGANCINCGAVFPMSDMHEAIDKGEVAHLCLVSEVNLLCVGCFDLVNIVLYPIITL